MSLYEGARRAMAALTDAPGFLSRPIDATLLDEMIAVATSAIPERFAEPPWRVVVVVGDERELLITQVAEALARHWGLGSLGPRGLASDKVLSAPALVLVFSTIPSSEGLEAFGLVAGAVQNLILLAHAAGMATHRIYSPHVVPETVLDFVGVRLGPEIRRGELVAMLAIGYPSQPLAPPERHGVRTANWIGRADQPAPAVEQATEVVARPANVLRALRRERVIVVDPYPYNRELIASYLAAAGYEVETCSHGKELLEAAAARQPSLLLIAETLPDTSGFELVRRLQAHSGLPVPIVMTTARRDSAFRISGLAAGIDYYLRKPINVIELYTAVRILLERYRLVSELRRATLFQETLLEAMASVGVLALDSAFRILYASPGATRLTGYAQEDLVGRAPAFLSVHGGQGPLLPFPPQTARADLQLRRKDGSLVDCEVMRSPLDDGKGGPAGYLTVFIDISERKAMERQLRNANGELERLLAELRTTQARLVQQAKMASLGQLVAGVAHEINTPLAAVVSNNDLFLRAFERLGRALQGSPLTEDARIRRDLEAIIQLSGVTRDACRRITGIVRTLRTFARLDEADVKAVDIHEGLESTLVLIAHLTKGGITVVRDYGELPPVDCHPNQINQVFMNLLVNACQSIDDTGVIRIETSLLRDAIDRHDPARRVDKVQVTITDSGRGIEPEHLPRIFDPGFTTKGVGVGTGLGLSICYQIVEAHGGDITVTSQPGEGSTFVVVLPVTG